MHAVYTSCYSMDMLFFDRKDIDATNKSVGKDKRKKRENLNSYIKLEVWKIVRRLSASVDMEEAIKSLCQSEQYGMIYEICKGTLDLWGSRMNDTREKRNKETQAIFISGA